MNLDLPGYAFAHSGHPNVVMGALATTLALLVLWGAVGWCVQRIQRRSPATVDLTNSTGE